MIASINSYRKGLVDIDTGAWNGPVIAADRVTEEQSIIVVTTNGRAIRIPADEISCMGRNTKGVNIIRLDDGDSVRAATVVPSE